MRFLLHDHSALPPPPPENLDLLPSPGVFKLFGVSFDRQVVLYILVAVAITLVALFVIVRALILRVNGRFPPAGTTLSASIEGDHMEGSERELLGLSAALVASFPSFVFDPKEAGKGEGEVTCIICLEEYKENDRLRRLPICGHAFHADCLDPWFKQHTTCPICRLSFLPKSTEEDENSSPPSISAVESGGQGDAPINSVVGNGARGEAPTEHFTDPQVVSRAETLMQTFPGRN